jgi:DNA (cytosine-5)-methyltransferase 1
MLRLACEIREIQGRLPYIIFENVPRLLSGPAKNPGEWFGEFLWALAEVGYDAEWFCLSASAIGAPHKRERVCIVAYASQMQCNVGKYYSKNRRSQVPEFGGCDSEKNASNSNQTPIKGGSISRRIQAQYPDIDGAASQWAEWGGGSPEICGMDDGIQSRSHRLGIMGNAIVPQCFALVMRALYESHMETIKYAL